MKSSMQKVKRPFIPDSALAGAWHGLTRSLPEQTQHALQQQPAIGPSQCWLFPTSPSSLSELSKALAALGPFLLSLLQFCLWLNIFPKAPSLNRGWAVILL